MFGLLAWAIATGAISVAGHKFSKDFVRRKLRFTSIVEKPGVAVAAGAVAVVAAAPVVGLLPIVGGVTALVFGAGVGTGVAVGAKEARGD